MQCGSEYIQKHDESIPFDFQWQIETACKQRQL